MSMCRANEREEETVLNLYTDAVLTGDIPEHRHKRGDIVKLADHHVAPDGEHPYPDLPPSRGKE